MTLHIGQSVVDTILRHASDEFPGECCGILIGRRSGADSFVDRAVAARNIAEGDRHKSYQIDWKTLFTAVRQTRLTPDEMIGFYHSHPDGSDRPSARDLESAWVAYSYVIVPVVEGRATGVRSWRWTSGKASLEQEPMNIS
jgi:proteasome lid subunit RPN8/RPN11